MIHLDEATLAAFAHAELPPEERRAVTRHLFLCDDGSCLDIIRQYLAFRAGGPLDLAARLDEIVTARAREVGAAPRVLAASTPAPLRPPPGFWLSPRVVDDDREAAVALIGADLFVGLPPTERAGLELDCLGDEERSFELERAPVELMDLGWWRVAGELEHAAAALCGAGVTAWRVRAGEEVLFGLERAGDRVRPVDELAITALEAADVDHWLELLETVAAMPEPPAPALAAPLRARVRELFEHPALARPRTLHLTPALREALAARAWLRA